MIALSRPSHLAAARPNWVAFWALSAREIARFMKDPIVTIVGPVVAPALLGLVVGMAGTPERAGPMLLGLTLTAAVSGAFGNTSSAILFWKVTRSLNDVLSAPVGPVLLVAGLVVPAMVRAVVVAAAALVAGALETRLVLVHPALSLLSLLLASASFAGLGVTVAILVRENSEANSWMRLVLFPMNVIGVALSLGQATPLTRGLGYLLAPTVFVRDFISLPGGAAGVVDLVLQATLTLLALAAPAALLALGALRE
jgi:ABC-2 type transport system permease protein